LREQLNFRSKTGSLELKDEVATWRVSRVKAGERVGQLEQDKRGREEGKEDTRGEQKAKRHNKIERHGSATSKGRRRTPQERAEEAKC
jgi:hypothetical protein